MIVSKLINARRPPFRLWFSPLTLTSSHITECLVPASRYLIAPEGCFVASRDTECAEIFFVSYSSSSSDLPSQISSFFYVFTFACSKLTLTSERSVPDRLFQQAKRLLPKQRTKTGYVSFWLILAF